MIAAYQAVCAIAMASVVTGAAAEPVEEKAKLCAACHGDAGKPADKAIPIIWGQHEGYLYLQLRDFKRGARKNEQMSAIVGALSRDDMKALAAYFAAKAWPDLQQPSASKAIAASASRANGSIGCTGCHLAEYQGDGSIPRLAGQSHEYLKKTIADFRSRARANNPGMSDLMNATPETDLSALAAYLAGW